VLAVKLCSHAARVPDGLLADLERHGVAATPAVPEGRPEPWIVWFEQCDPALLETIQAARGAGLGRVLAVAASGEALASGAARRILLAGAGDVIAHQETAAIAARLERWHSVDQLVASPLVRRHLVGGSPIWIATLREIVEAAAFSDHPVLLLGESGTGKEQLSRLIHTLDPRSSKGELVVLDCTTVVPELSGSEFFGHDRGAFTGAVGPREGAFALADGGTLFLDEVGELPPPLQAQLLRVVQEHSFKRVGGNTWQTTRFRLVCATNRDLQSDVRAGGFRKDFFHRIAGWVCRIPSLKERPGDILPLVEHFLAEARPGHPSPPIDAAVRELLAQRSYPGNVRELRHLVWRIAQRHVGQGPITIGDVPRDELPEDEAGGEWRDAAFQIAITRALAHGIGLKEIGRAACDTAIQIALASEEGNLQRAARRLGVTDRALQLRRANRGDGRE
jgi:transcriptional regulator with GAF, ATPase, and Fis domain